ncbi:hypothetical protein NDU88_001832 [Pleurodeles waltl]|uniref:Uncharacterized protein n=1 Tax=Pleurodeles waltl TaxID=8319 RepID=A0AAV7U9J8_PLEWA|nr:hypothetical protein NDU88_001832 [Pleurodeles waltl]
MPLPRPLRFGSRPLLSWVASRLCAVPCRPWRVNLLSFRLLALLFVLAGTLGVCPVEAGVASRYGTRSPEAKVPFFCCEPCALCRLKKICPGVASPVCWGVTRNCLRGRVALKNAVPQCEGAIPRCEPCALCRLEPLCPGVASRHKHAVPLADDAVLWCAPSARCRLCESGRGLAFHPMPHSDGEARGCEQRARCRLGRTCPGSRRVEKRGRPRQLLAGAARLSRVAGAGSDESPTWGHVALLARSP